MNRVHLKQNAKETVRRNYIPWLLVGIITIVLSYANSQNQVSSDFDPTSYLDIRVRWLNLLQLILTVPLTRVAIDLTDGVYQNATDSLFRNAQWVRDIGAMLLVGIYTTLWTFLFIIPGIVKGYAYSMVPYILADDPNIGISDAIKLSQDMTYGFKIDLLIMDFSFILWNIASAFTFGLVGLYAVPYQSATWAQYYVFLSERNE
ncbi:hypothetical protein BW727_100381 [Jeotgalibaca dankookensis]|uniref:DUF975 family protein n=1 Tax=Jeotgalibaca dankookensis TaxID=708126 RepID=A0A1S6IMJ5_9LACT|nr:DUF975 family protein [Jeotgalibaca dankookensis]AQS52774.1 hypothetical protein BW727_100381 [Jeotgalibaca dankookensis]